MSVAVACPDKFRGSLSGPEAAGAFAAGLHRAGFDAVREMPLADGGEGTLDALLHARRGTRRRTRVTGPLGEPVDAEWGMLPDGTAVIEMARASGLVLVGSGNDPLRATTRGTGELIAAARSAGARRAVVGVGGSATTDGGLGAVDALGWSLAGMPVAVACDVTSAFMDAAVLYGPQKHATAAQISLLTRRLGQVAEQYRTRLRVDVTALEGAGAAGGLAGGLAAIGAVIEPGFDVIARAAGLDAMLEGADFVVTGEGRLDLTSLAGKVVGGVLEWAAEREMAPAAVIAGQVVDEARVAVERDYPGTNVLALVDRVWQSGEAFSRAALLAEEAALEAGRVALGTADPEGPSAPEG